MTDTPTVPLPEKETRLQHRGIVVVALLLAQPAPARGLLCAAAAVLRGLGAKLSTELASGGGGGGGNGSNGGGGGKSGGASTAIVIINSSILLNNSIITGGNGGNGGSGGSDEPCSFMAAAFPTDLIIRYWSQT